MKNIDYCIIYLTRHGETEWNEKKLIQGHTDIPLNEKGKKQAKQLGFDVITKLRLVALEYNLILLPIGGQVPSVYDSKDYL